MRVRPAGTVTSSALLAMKSSSFSVQFMKRGTCARALVLASLMRCSIKAAAQARRDLFGLQLSCLHAHGVPGLRPTASEVGQVLHDLRRRHLADHRNLVTKDGDHPVR